MDAKQVEIQNKGIFSSLKSQLDKKRLGDLLLANGLITQHQLDRALNAQKITGQVLGQVFIDQKLITRRQLAYALGKQKVFRLIAGTMLFVASFSFNKDANADTGIKDVPARISLASASMGQYTKMYSHPAFMGSAEKASYNLKPFVKWTAMFERFEKELNTASGSQTINNWRAELAALQGLPLRTLAERVNELVNKRPYVTDNRNWGQSDYWATPVEFLKNGGDCEDFAITKYTAMRALGVPESRLRIAIVHDNEKNIPHAVLIVYTDEGSFILDNQNKHLISATHGTRYKPIFSINQQAWWLHTVPQSTRVASVATAAGY